MQNEIFDENMLNRAKNIIKILLENRFSKYNGLKHEDLKINAKIGQKIILIPAQVEDDASMILGVLAYLLLICLRRCVLKIKMLISSLNPILMC